MQRIYFPALLAFLLLTTALVGCGGSHGLSSSITENIGARGRATLTILWPERTRLIPFAANSLRIEVRDGNGAVVGSQILERPPVGGTKSTTFDLLPVGNLTIQATANPNANGSGIAQAKATAPLVIQAGQTTNFHLSLASTIDRIELNPSTGITLAPGQNRTFTATAKDAQGNTVLAAPQTLQWTSSSTATATVNAGQVTAVANGSAQITVQETESGKSASVTVTVQHPALVSWWKAEGNAQDSVGGNHGTLRNGATFDTGTTGQAFLFDGVDDAISIPDTESLKLTQSLTIDTLINVTGIPSAAQIFSMIVFRGDSRQGLDPYFLAIHSNGRLYFHVESTTSSFDISAPVPTAQWVRVTATLDDATGQMRLYFNGAQVAQGTTTVRPLRALDPALGPGTGIGNHSGFPNSSFNYPFKGRIDEVKIYSAVVPPGG